jgi:hypothetical protein
MRTTDGDLHQMKRTDFIDTDLVLKRDGARPVDPYRKLPGDPADDGEVASHSISEVSLGRMARHKEEIKTGVVSAISEMETLRRRQDELAQEKKDLEELSQKQQEYERGKREVIDHLSQAIVALEKKEVQAAQLIDLLVVTRNRFKELLDEVERIDEEQWPDGDFRKELYKAVVVIDDARMEHNKALGKIQVLEAKGESILDNASVARMVDGHVAGERSFGHWVKVGFAISLPLWLLAIFALVAYVIFHFGFRT